MKKETIKSVLHWTIIVIVLVGVIVFIRACNKRQDRLSMEERQRKKLEMAQSKYLYVDKNNVYHIDPRCHRMDEHYYEVHEDGDERLVDAIYSSKRIKKTDVRDWEYFASNHQLCNKCFKDEMIHILDSIYHDYPCEEVVVEEVVVECDDDDMIHTLYVRALEEGILSYEVSEERFRMCLNDSEERKSFYDYAINHGMDLPNYQDFCNKYK